MKPSFLDRSPIRAVDSRREFLRHIGIAGSAVVANATTPWLGNVSVARGQLVSKPDLITLNDNPYAGEASAKNLDDVITPTDQHFLFLRTPLPREAGLEGSFLSIDGRISNSLLLSRADLFDQFNQVTEPVLLECAGNGRGLTRPPGRGTQWMFGAVGCAEWTGVLLADLLERASPFAGSTVVNISSLDDDADDGSRRVFPTLPRTYGLDFLRSTGALLAFAMNGQPIPSEHGGPYRLIVPGISAGYSRKWVKRITVSVGAENFQAVPGFRIPRTPLRPGEQPAEGIFRAATTHPVKSLITRPVHGTVTRSNRIGIKGHVWGGRAPLRLHLSINFGATWFEVPLSEPPGPHAWYSFAQPLVLPSSGYFELWARAFDQTGIGQPFKPNWNPDGILNNMVHRIAVYHSAT